MRLVRLVLRVRALVNFLNNLNPSPQASKKQHKGKKVCVFAKMCEGMSERKL